MQVVRQVPEGFEAVVQRVRAPSSFTISTILSTADDPAQSIHRWESRVKVDEEQAGDNVAENIDLAVLEKYLCDGELVRHLDLQSGRLTTYELARKEAINHLRVKQTWMATDAADPMDLSPLGKFKRWQKRQEQLQRRQDDEAKERSASTVASPVTARVSAGTSLLR